MIDRVTTNIRMNKEDYALRAIGRITVSFSALENIMAESIREFITDDYELSRVITARLNFVELLALLGALVKYRIQNDRALESFDDIAARLTGLNEKRNTHLHSQWYILGNSIVRKKFTKTAKKGLHVDQSQLELGDLLDFVDQINMAGMNLTEFMDLNRDAILEQRKRTADRTATVMMKEWVKNPKGVNL